LDNQPSCTNEIKPGLVVWFESRHLIDVQRDGDKQPGTHKSFEYASSGPDALMRAAQFKRYE